MDTTRGYKNRTQNLLVMCPWKISNLGSKFGCMDTPSSHEIEHPFSNKAQCLVYRQLHRHTKRRLCNTRSVADSSLVHSSTLTSLLFSEHLTIVKINHFSATYIFPAHTVISAQWWWYLTMTNFCRLLSNCQPHHAVHISVASTTVLTTTTMHNTVLGTTVQNAPHFLCPAKVSAHICLPLMYITIDQYIVPTLPNILYHTIVHILVHLLPT